MKMKLIFACVLLSNALFAQKHNAYTDSLVKFRQNYIATHEVVKGENIKYLDFFRLDKSFLVKADFIKYNKKEAANMKTFAGPDKTFIKYGLIRFKIKGKPCELTIYQSEHLGAGYADYLFLPFTDSTSARTTYGGGRYIDLSEGDIKLNKIIIDFNKAYNPYCAYSPAYMCPIPPRENDLSVAVEAGEKNYLKGVH